MASSNVGLPEKEPEDRSLVQQHLIEAFTPQFVEYLEPNMILNRLNTLNEEQKEQINKLENSVSRHEAVRKLIQLVKETNCVSEFIMALKIENFERFQEVFEDKEVSNIQQTGRQYCEFLLQLLRAEIIEHITDPLKVAQEMRQGNYLTERNVEVIRCIFNSIGPTAACDELFRSMPRKKSDWSFAFFKIMEKQNPAMFQLLGVNPAIKAAVYNSPPDPNPSQPGPEGAAQGRQSSDSTGDEGFSDNEKDDSSDKEYNDYGYPDLQMRNYQFELSEVAVKGENTIICAPTGSGKTRVALYIVKKHLESASAENPKKIVFLARTTPLVNQQAKTFQKYLECRVQHVTGESELSLQLHNILNHYDILVLTPQILDNHLRDGKIKSLSVFSLLILDECHHTRKGEPYNNLMKKYLKAKKLKEQNLPQIIGLTASLGVEKATTCDDAMTSILKLCANLDVFKLSTVKENKAELDATVPVPDERREVLTGNRNDGARKEITLTMAGIEVHLDAAAAKLNNKEITTLLRKRPSEYTSQAYGQWAVKIKQAARVLNTESEEAKLIARTIVVVARQLEIYNAALDIHDLVRLQDVISYLEKKLNDNLGKNKHTEVESALSTSFRDLRKNLEKFEKTGENPNLKKLAKILIDLRKEKGPDSLGIIFVRTRATCYALCDWMKSVEELKCLNAEAFTGAGAHEDEGGMTQNEQDAIIGRFRDGKIKLIIATSVAEEGLDIPECNIVIRYNHVGNEITTVQTRGRSRKRGGVSVLLGSNQIVQREMLNVERSKMMTEAILKLRQLPENAITSKISKYQIEAIEEEEINEVAKQYRLNRKREGHFKLRCMRCRNLTIDSTDIRTVQGAHHVVIDPSFMKKVDTRPDKDPHKPFDGIQIAGKIHCKECHNYLGITFKYKGNMFPALKLECYQFIDGDKVTNHKKWQSIPFKVKEIAVADYHRMFGDRETFNDFDDNPLDNDAAAACSKEDRSSYDNEKDTDESWG
ncbi:ATP-dependent RNA helicase DHX58 [Patella vulgata]|uniref:ATP-dependent RNA helicase DHX58 n=1 Tax=Patella vulgata TaxID=6465 RepID=UPI00217F804D|nr:ATP-dependent RNA helicase DHX58 [Patella vulgata]XP_050398835.1 ATP-dependent RNA helicase DHX58 [Patella vulgata]